MVFFIGIGFGFRVKPFIEINNFSRMNKTLMLLKKNFQASGGIRLFPKNFFIENYVIFSPIIPN